MTLKTNPRAVVTGAGSGLGRAIALALAKRGGRILLADLNLDTAEETASLVREKGGAAATLRCDVSKKEEVCALPERVKEAFGGVDIVVNNAGVALGGPFHEIPATDWEWMMGINLWGVIYGCIAFVPVFREQRAGHIINIASAAGLVVGPIMAPYNVAKAGVIALSETLCGELASEGVGVSVVCPSFFRTNINKDARLYGDRSRETLDRRLDKPGLSADDVAEITLRGADRGDLYIVPHTDALWTWRAKRASPEAFYKRLMPRALKQVREHREGRSGNLIIDLLSGIRKRSG